MTGGVEKVDSGHSKNSTVNDDIKKLAHLISISKFTVFFGGAGVSTESGIPDFRSKDGLYNAKKVYGYSPEELLSHTFFMQKPELFFKYYRENLVSLNAEPNHAHNALAELEKRGMLRFVITQNIDGLHQAAGSKNVLELHGSNHRHYCISCNSKYSLDYIISQADIIPRCDKCGGIVRPDVVLYEESLDSAVMENSVRALSSAELLIVGGTSLAVYPAAGLLNYFTGGALVLINKSETPADSSAELVIHDSIGIVLSAVMRMLD